MKLLLTSLIFFSFFGSSFAFKIKEAEIIEEEDLVLTSYIWQDISFAEPTIGVFTIPAISKEQVALMAKLDSNEVQLNRLREILDSMNQVQIDQSSSIERLKRLDQQSKDRMEKAKRLREEKSQTSIWIISLVAISTVICAFFALRLYLSKNRK